MLKRFALSLILLCALVTPAKATDVNGVYFSAKLVDSIQSAWIGVSAVGLSENRSYLQNTIGGAFAIGYDFYPKLQFPLRAEVEYAIRGNVTQSENLERGAVLKGTWGVQTLLANVYLDFHNSTAFTPYIGAGLGMGFINSRYTWETAGVSLSKSASNTVFAWSIGAGCSYAFNEYISADLGYRYLGLGENKVKWGGTNLDTTHGAHEVSLGVRVTF